MSIVGFPMKEDTYEISITKRKTKAMTLMTIRTQQQTISLSTIYIYVSLGNRTSNAIFYNCLLPKCSDNIAMHIIHGQFTVTIFLMLRCVGRWLSLVQLQGSYSLHELCVLKQLYNAIISPDLISEHCNLGCPVWPSRALFILHIYMIGIISYQKT